MTYGDFLGTAAALQNRRTGAAGMGAIKNAAAQGEHE